MRMADALLAVEDLHTQFGKGDSAIRAVDGVSFEIRRGETFALLGESGCGKSMTALSLMRLLPQPAGHITAGRVLLEGENLFDLPEAAMRRYRGGRIAMIFQEPMTSLNPVMTIGRQIEESLEQHKQLRGDAARSEVINLLDAVGIPDAPRRYGEYPHQLSGGMKQRVMIAIALAADPDLLIADEPTTALDVTIQSQVLDLLNKLQRERGMAILLITHDLGVVAQMADRVAVMYAGQIVEQAPRKAFFEAPQHPYSQKLFAALPEGSRRDEPLAVIPGSVPPLNTVFTGCRFLDRCDRGWSDCKTVIPAWIDTATDSGVRCHLADAAKLPGDPLKTWDLVNSSDMPAKAAVKTGSQLLEVDDLKVHFPIRRGFFKRIVGYVKAVDGIDVTIPTGETLALVGESGCGKTTVGKSILQLLKPTAGSVRFEGEELTTLRGEALRRRRADFQIIFQDPFASMNPRMSVGEIIEEGMVAQRIGDRASRRQRVEEMLQQVGMREQHSRRYPHEFSGGQRQRICIARSLAVAPKLLVCDEPTSALDVSVQAQILNLLKDLQKQLGLAYLFITHDISVVAYLASRVAVMYLGRIVEEGRVDEVLENPRHPYTQALLSAVPTIDADSGRSIIRLEGDMPSPANPPAGCHFHPRCQYARPECRTEYPGITVLSETHKARCYLLRE